MSTDNSTVNLCPYCGTKLFGNPFKCYKCGKSPHVGKSKFLKKIEDLTESKFLKKIENRIERRESISVRVNYNFDASFPDVCPCCLQKCAEGEAMSVNMIVPSIAQSLGKVFKIPTCTYCQKHWNKSQKYIQKSRWLMGVMIFFLIGLITSIVKISQTMGFLKAIIIGIGIGCVLSIMFWLIRLPFKPKKIHLDGHLDSDIEPVSVQYDTNANREFIIFTFGNKKYADLFKNLNSIIS